MVEDAQNKEVSNVTPGKRKSINDDTVVQVEDRGAHSSINSAPELVEDGATAVYCEATTTASSSKILDIGSESHPDILLGYRLMGVNILDGIFNCLWLLLNVMKLKHFI